MFRRMFRIGLLTAGIVCSFFISASAQKADTAGKIAPEITSLLTEVKEVLAPVEPKVRAAGLFHLLDFQMQLENKASAEETLHSLLTLAPSITEEQHRSQIYKGVADAYGDLQKDTEAAALMSKIAAPADRAEFQLHYAVKIITEMEEDAGRKFFDTAGLLRRAIADAAAAKNAGLESLGQAFLGRELARQKKNEDAEIAFSEALKTAKKTGDTEEQELIGIVLRSQIQHGLIPAASATLAAVAVPETKQALTKEFIQSLIQYKKFAEAETAVKKLPAGKIKDTLLLDFAMENIKTVSDEQIGILAAMISTDAAREQVLQQIVAGLRRNNRNDAAESAGKRMSDPKKFKAAVIFGDIDRLMEAKQFAEAVKVSELLEDPQLKSGIKREIFIAQYRETRDEALLAPIAALYTAEEKEKSAKLESTKKTAENAETGKQIDTLLGVMESQFELMDIKGAKQTMILILSRLDKVSDLAKIVQCRLLIAQLQIELRETSGAKENLGQLIQMLGGVQDLNLLKGLVNVPPGGQPADAAAIRDQLFQIHAAAAELLIHTDALPEFQAALGKAKTFADAEPFAIAKADKLLLLARIRLQNQMKNGK
ncbi:MAG: hypothetical protein LBH00_05635 [Planctomycetaceae bacterium]|jgi:hypothetical protein|nr:hypothetical protein [Planctomycetaceae bacterium]